jgi:hypothetical protein
VYWLEAVRDLGKFPVLKSQEEVQTTSTDSMVTTRAITRLAAVGVTALLFGCGPPKPNVPSLTPDTAYALLQVSNKAESWIRYVKKNNPSCAYQLELPDQSAHPATIDLDHIIRCGGRPSPKEFDASVTFQYDPAQQRWTVSRFSS